MKRADVLQRRSS